MAKRKAKAGPAGSDSDRPSDSSPNEGTEVAPEGQDWAEVVVAPERTFMERTRLWFLRALSMMTPEQLAEEDAARKLREEKEAEEREYDALPWIQKCERFPLKVNLLSIAEVKSALDDAVRSMLIDEAGFAEDNTHSNRKLLLGYVAIVIALVASSYSFLVPFQESRWIVGSAVATYFLLVLAMWLYGLLVEKDCIFVGVQSNPLLPHIQRVHVSSTFDRRTADYTANFRFSKIPPPASGPREVPRACQKSVGAWFDVDGRFAAGIFRADIEDVLKGNVLHVQ